MIWRLGLLMFAVGFVLVIIVSAILTTTVEIRLPAGSAPLDPPGSAWANIVVLWLMSAFAVLIAGVVAWVGLRIGRGIVRDHGPTAKSHR